ncbi:MAG: hypothetical protein K8F91_21385, partial [Candidatus Obscuribacterales bacterium]|nr:hypothetical protein [Candidatus Obscuribacterales bacterium]
HFEKMLYDNALLCQTYLTAQRCFDKPYWRKVAGDILAFVSNELQTESGAFYSSLDADSEGEEGKYYVFDKKELSDILGDESGEWMAKTFGVSTLGNFEHGTSVLHLIDSPQALAAKDNLSVDQFFEKISPLVEKLLDYRSKRIRPGRDEKVLTSWNSLMISAFVDGYLVFQDPTYLDTAKRAARFILDNLTRDGGLLRTWGKGKAKINGYLDDYAYFINSLLDLAAVDPDPAWYERAEEFCRFMIEHFLDEQSGGFFYTADDHEELVVRPRSHFDGSVPSGTSMAALCLLRLSRLSANESYGERVKKVLSLYTKVSTRSPDQFANMLCVLDSYLVNPKEVALVFDSKQNASFSEFLFAINSFYRPDDVTLIFDTSSASLHKSPLLEGKQAIDGKPTLYVCRNFSCSDPITDIDRIKDVFDPSQC